jgi:hypothetical protein
MSDRESSDFEQVPEATTPNAASTSSTSPTMSSTPAAAVAGEPSTSDPDAAKPSDEAQPPIQEHSTTSFEDGNLVIVAETMAFRVHRGVLSRKSALFKDLLSLPQPDSEERWEGLPVVRLLDSAEDVTMLLDAIYNGAKSVLSLIQSSMCIGAQADGLHANRYRYRDDETPNWTTVHRLLVLGTKYQVEELRDEAVHQLHARYPRKIADWDYTCRTDGDTASTIVVSYPIEEDLVIANVARALDLPDIHLAALYGCCSLAPDVLVRGRVLEDGSTVERLCADDLVACVQGRENLLVAARTDVRMKLFAPDGARAEACRTPGECGEKAAALCARYCAMEPRPRRLYDPLRPDDEEIERDCADVGLCHDCVKYFLGRHAKLRQDVRDNLGTYICANKAP